jgi:DNA-binding NarL/FixJ family response regulator
VLADDAVLVREGIARVLEARGIEVIAQAGDAETLIQITTELCPDVAIVDVRMPPTHTVEGLDAAECILSRRPKTSVLLLSQDLQPHYARRLLDARPCGVGYLLKESIADTREFADAITKIAAGGTAFAPDLVQQQP